MKKNILRQSCRIDQITRKSLKSFIPYRLPIPHNAYNRSHVPFSSLTGRDIPSDLVMLHDSVKSKMKKTALPLNPPSNDVYDLQHEICRYSEYSLLFFVFVENSILFEHFVVFTHFVEYFFPFHMYNMKSQCNGFSISFTCLSNKFHSYNSFSEINFIELHKYIPKYHKISRIFSTYSN